MYIVAPKSAGKRAVKLLTPKMVVANRINNEFKTWLSEIGHQCIGCGFRAYCRNEPASSIVIDCRHARITTIQKAAIARQTSAARLRNKREGISSKVYLIRFKEEARMPGGYLSTTKLPTNNASIPEE